MIASEKRPAKTRNILLLGGTGEASALAQALAGRDDLAVTLSYAGRVATPKAQPVAIRVGGFGGIAGLRDYLRAQAIDAVIDATHPFAAQMSANAVAACAEEGVPLVALERPAWQAAEGDRWIDVADLEGAAEYLADAAPVPRNVFLAIGRLHLHHFARAPQHRYTVRLIDEPGEVLPLPQVEAIIARGPFTMEGDAALLAERGIDLIVAKNSGGAGAFAKIAAARSLGLPVIMIARPEIPARARVESVAQVIDWLDHAAPSGGVPDQRGV
jgi:precorrin-6A/cobalt-precorrin-6A reductase